MLVTYLWSVKCFSYTLPLILPPCAWVTTVATRILIGMVYVAWPVLCLIPAKTLPFTLILLPERKVDLFLAGLTASAPAHISLSMGTHTTCTVHTLAMNGKSDATTDTVPMNYLLRN